MWCGAQSWAGWTLERRALPPGGMSVKRGGLPPASIRRAASSQPLLSLPRVPPQRPGAGVGGAVSGSQSLETRVAASPPWSPPTACARQGAWESRPTATSSPSGVLPPASFPSPSLPLGVRGSRTKFLMTDTLDETTTREKREIPLFFFKGGSC